MQYFLFSHPSHPELHHNWVAKYTPARQGAALSYSSVNFLNLHNSRKVFLEGKYQYSDFGTPREYIRSIVMDLTSWNKWYIQNVSHTYNSPSSNKSIAITLKILLSKQNVLQRDFELSLSFKIVYYPLARTPG